MNAQTEIRKPRTRRSFRRYCVQVVVMLTELDGERLKEDAKRLGVSQADLAREAIRFGYEMALREVGARRSSVIPTPKVAGTKSGR